MSRSAPRFGRACLMALVLCPIGLLQTGCGPGAGLPEGGTPVVQPNSEAGKKALAENETMIKERQEQEAKDRKRRASLPTEG